jgi:hypothetical protein
MKKLLIISPHFPPVNAADMHRVRQSLPYFKEFGWEPVVFAVEPERVEQSKDELLLQSFPEGIEIHNVTAFSTKWTRKFGLGNLGIRSYLQLKKAVNRYLTSNHVDLVYFSTTVFVSMALGPYWKKKFGVSFVIDMQDPWRNDYSLQLPRSKRPKKFWFDYPLNKYLEARTIPEVAGIVSVSQGYCDMLQERYPSILPNVCLTLPFGALEKDYEIAATLPAERTTKDQIDICYIGRGGDDMALAVRSLFRAFKRGLARSPDLFSNVRFTFIGTSYAANGCGIPTITPFAVTEGVAKNIREQTDRLPYFRALRRLQEADLLFMPGSTDANYTASKLYPYILAQKPLLALFNENSSVVDILDKTQAGETIAFRNNGSIEELSMQVQPVLEALLKKLPYTPNTNWAEFEPYTAKEMTRKQCDFFAHLLEKKDNRQG